VLRKEPECTAGCIRVHANVCVCEGEANHYCLDSGLWRLREEVRKAARLLEKFFLRLKTPIELHSTLLTKRLFTLLYKTRSKKSTLIFQDFVNLLNRCNLQSVRLFSLVFSFVSLHIASFVLNNLKKTKLIMYEIIRFKKVFRHKVFKNINITYL